MTPRQETIHDVVIVALALVLGILWVLFAAV